MAVVLVLVLASTVDARNGRERHSTPGCSRRVLGTRVRVGLLGVGVTGPPQAAISTELFLTSGPSISFFTHRRDGATLHVSLAFLLALRSGSAAEGMSEYLVVFGADMSGGDADSDGDGGLVVVEVDVGVIVP